MLIALISPNIPHNRLGTISPWDVPSLSLGYLAAVLREAGHQVKILDSLILNLSPLEIFHEIVPLNPDVVGLTSNSFSAQYAIETAKYLKKYLPGVPLIIGGVYATDAFEDLLGEGIVDYVVRGEGERTIVELIAAISGELDIKEVDGIAYREGETIIVNKPRELIEDLDSLPSPAWDLFPSLKAYKNLRGVLKRPYLPIFTSRGCPYGCIWCSKNIHGRKFRYRSPLNVFQEIYDDVHKFKIKEIAIMDDSFTQDRTRAIEICKMIIKADLHININLYSGVRADKLDPLLLKFLARAGVNRITVGVESGNQYVVKKIGKNLNLRKLLAISHQIKEMGFIFDAFFMFGLPYDTEKTMEQTIQFARALDPHHAYFFITTPFIGTKLYEMIKENNWFLEECHPDSPHHIVQGHVAFVTRNFTKEQVLSKFKASYRRFYLYPRKIWSLAVLYYKLFLKYRSFSALKWVLSQGLFFLKKNK